MCIRDRTKYIPEFAEVRETAGKVKDVTIRRLMTHYSGLSTETSLMSWGAEEFPQLNEILNALPDTEIVIPADSQWNYCNLAFGLLGEVIARVSGVEYVEYVKRNVIEPLGLELTAFDREDLPVEQLFTGYDAVVPGDPSRSELRVADYLHLNGCAPWVSSMNPGHLPNETGRNHHGTIRRIKHGKSAAWKFTLRRSTGWTRA